MLKPLVTIALFAVTINTSLRASSFYDHQDFHPLNKNCSGLVDEYAETLTVHHFMNDARELMIRLADQLTSEDFYSELLPIYSMYLEHPDYEIFSAVTLSPSEKLAHIFLEAIIWYHLEGYFSSADQIDQQIRLKFSENLMGQVEEYLRINDWLKFENKVIQKLRDDKSLSKEISINSPQNTTIISQIASILVMKKSLSFKGYLSEFAIILQKKIGDQNIIKLLGSVEIPESQSILVNTQINLIKKYLMPSDQDSCIIL